MTGTPEPWLVVDACERPAGWYLLDQGKEPWAVDEVAMAPAAAGGPSRADRFPMW